MVIKEPRFSKKKMFTRQQHLLYGFGVQTLLWPVWPVSAYLTEMHMKQNYVF